MPLFSTRRGLPAGEPAPQTTSSHGSGVAPALQELPQGQASLLLLPGGDPSWPLLSSSLSESEGPHAWAKTVAHGELGVSRFGVGPLIQLPTTQACTPV